jgi:hypothetical protein
MTLTFDVEGSRTLAWPGGNLDARGYLGPIDKQPTVGDRYTFSLHRSSSFVNAFE